MIAACLSVNRSCLWGRKASRIHINLSRNKQIWGCWVSLRQWRKRLVTDRLQHFLWGRSLIRTFTSMQLKPIWCHLHEHIFSCQLSDLWQRCTRRLQFTSAALCGDRQESERLFTVCTNIIYMHPSVVYHATSIYLPLLLASNMELVHIFFFRTTRAIW